VGAASPLVSVVTAAVYRHTITQLMRALYLEVDTHR